MVEFEMTKYGNNPLTNYNKTFEDKSMFHIKYKEYLSSPLHIVICSSNSIALGLLLQ